MFKTSLGVTNDRVPGETNDCAVIALANVTGLPYTDIHSRLKSKGRRFRRGTKIPMIASVLDDLKAEGVISEYKSVFTNERMRPPTVQQFVNSVSNTGRYFLCSTTHSLALVDGTVYDNAQRTRARARMRVAVKVTMSRPTPPPPPLVAPKAIVRFLPVQHMPAPVERPRFSAEEYQRRAIAAKLAQL